MRAFDRALGWSIAAGSVLVMPLSLLLFVQWPLRDLLHAFSREANDLGQIFFALYVALAVTAATRARAHLAVNLFSRGYSPGTQVVLERAAALFVAIPSSLFVLVSGARPTWTATAHVERFPETMTSGYFLLRIAVLVLAAMVLAQAVIDLVAPRRPEA